MKRPKKGPRAKAAARIDSNRANKTRSKKEGKKVQYQGRVTNTPSPECEQGVTLCQNLHLRLIFIEERRIVFFSEASLDANRRADAIKWE